jgi:hypothetical protein
MRTSRAGVTCVVIILPHVMPYRATAARLAMAARIDVSFVQYGEE